ncbi:MAG: hypothetical protein ATN34_03895 [Epulopiscium sp. Nele67-Bin002]|nr:MAG: hypothetical protein ATN34_03895 [Epulopiscium sp. Nele67-Bin002]OON94120.1 MAG: hypothetical protein ATN33_04875 [Epulopiscium sp. Nele67-Bin001]
MITTNLIKREILKDKSYKAMVFLLLIFSFIIGTNLPQAIHYNMSVAEFVLYSLANHNYLIYGYFFFIIMFITSNIKNTSDIELVRMSNRNHYNAIKFIAMGIKFGILILLHIALIVIQSSGHLTWQLVFNGQSYDFLGEALYNAFANPATGVVIVSLYLWLGSLFLYQIMAYIYNKFSSGVYLTSIGIILLTTMFGFYTGVDESILAIFFPNNYFIFHHACLVIGKFMYEILLLIMLTTSAITILKGINLSLSKTYSSLFIVIILLLNAIINNYSVADYLFIHFKGFSKTNFDLVELLLFALLYFIPMFLISSFIDKERDSKNDLMKFRYKSVANWNKVIEKKMNLFLAQYLLGYIALVIASSLIYWLFKFDVSSSLVTFLPEYFNIPHISWGIVIGIVCVAKPLELYILYVLNKLLNKLTNNTIVSFLVSFLIFLPLSVSSVYQIVRFLYL